MNTTRNSRLGVKIRIGDLVFGYLRIYVGSVCLSYVECGNSDGVLVYEMFQPLVIRA